MNDILSNLAYFIAKTILRDPSWKIEPDEPLISSGLVDSFSLVELALYVEEQYGVHLADTELNAETIDTLTALKALIESRQKK